MAKKVDLIGMRYGKLTVVERTDQRTRLLSLAVPLRLRRRDTGQYEEAEKRDCHRLWLYPCGFRPQRPYCGGSDRETFWKAYSDQMY